VIVWYTARGAGLSALVLLTASVCLGALASGRGTPGTRYVTQYVHRVCAGLGVGVLVLHIATILADKYANVGVTGALVPFTSGYRATWVGLGTIAAYLLLLVTVLGAARGRMAASSTGARLWRSVHAFGYAAWALALWHGWATGTDTSASWVRALYVVCALSGTGVLAWRWIEDGKPKPLVRRPQPVRVTESVG
jgi:methionine sulfoxide reductase heme-binding subunit